MSPQDFKTRILLSVTGMSTQVLTETLYALVTEQNFTPTKIIVITTALGKNKLIRDLLDEKDGQFYAFCREYNLVGQIEFDHTCIEVIHDDDGQYLPDIRTPKENNFAANKIVSVVQRLSRDPNAALHVSIAGGRKSMGFFLGYALSLFARPQDKLSHVLVSEPFENNRDFYFPPKENKNVILSDGEVVNSSFAKVMLAEIPLVRLREGLPDNLILGTTTYSNAVQLAQAGIALEPSLRFDRNSLVLICGGESVKLLPNEFATMLWMAQLRKAGVLVRPGENVGVEDFLKVYRQVVHANSADYERAVAALRYETDFLRRYQENRSKIKRKLIAVLGARAKPYLIESIRAYTKTCYQLGLSPDSIDTSIE